MDCELKRLEEKIQEMEYRLYSITDLTFSDMPRGGKPTDISDRISKLTDMKALYNAKWDELISERKKIEEAINTLDDCVERALMGYKYIDGLTWEEVCVEIGYEWAQTHRMHSKALIKLKT